VTTISAGEKHIFGGEWQEIQKRILQAKANELRGLKHFIKHTACRSTYLSRRLDAFENADEDQNPSQHKAAENLPLHVAHVADGLGLTEHHSTE